MSRPCSSLGHSESYRITRWCIARLARRRVHCLGVSGMNVGGLSIITICTSSVTTALVCFWHGQAAMRARWCGRFTSLWPGGKAIVRHVLWVSIVNGLHWGVVGRPRSGSWSTSRLCMSAGGWIGPCLSVSWMQKVPLHFWQVMYAGGTTSRAVHKTQADIC